MENTGIQVNKTLEEQLKNLKKEQVQAEELYKNRVGLGELARDPESLKDLAQAILERKMKIDSLESQIAMQNSSKDYNTDQQEKKKIQK